MSVTVIVSLNVGDFDKWHTAFSSMSSKRKEAGIHAKGQSESGCHMINYRYRQKEIESNHENYHTDGEISCSKAVNALVQL